MISDISVATPINEGKMLHCQLCLPTNMQKKLKHTFTQNLFYGF